jgi:hypothetical protein
VQLANLEERVDLDGGLGDAGECALGTLASGAETAERAGVLRDVELGLALELLLEVVKQGVVEVLAAKVRVTRGGLDRKDTAGDVKERDIESSAAEVEDEHVLLTLSLAVETVGNGGGGRLVDDTEDVKAGDRASVLSRKTLRVVEVGGDAARTRSAPCSAQITGTTRT